MNHCEGLKSVSVTNETKNKLLCCLEQVCSGKSDPEVRSSRGVHHAALYLSATPDLPSGSATAVWSLQATQTLNILLLHQSPKGTGTVKQTQQSYFGVCWFTVIPRYEPLWEVKSKQG
jgi:hypothetical protein